MKELILVRGLPGSGKSTFLSLGACLDRPDSGKIIIHGEDIVKMSEDELSMYRAKHVGIVFQHFHLMQNLSALENIMLPLEILNIPDAKEKAKRLAKEGPIEEEVKPKTLDTSKPITLDFLTNPDKE